MDTIQLKRSDDALLQEAIQNLMSQVFLFHKNHQVKSILLTNCGLSSNSESAAVVGAELAIALAEVGRKIHMIHLDYWPLPLLTTSTKFPANLSSYLHESGKYPWKVNALSQITYHTNFENLLYTPGCDSKEDLNQLFYSKKLHRIFNKSCASPDLTIISAPSIGLWPAAKVLFKSVGGIGLVVDLDHNTKRELSYAKYELQPFIEKYMGLIVTNIAPKKYKRFFS